MLDKLAAGRVFVLDKLAVERVFVLDKLAVERVFVLDKLAVGLVSLRVLRLDLSGSFYRYSFAPSITDATQS